MSIPNPTTTQTGTPVAPEDTDTLRALPGEDLVTLITCTPLGINTHRIIVTGERITPTPEKDIRAAGLAPTIPGFPWWIVIGGVGLLAIGGYVAQRGYVDPQLGSTSKSKRPRGGRAAHK